MKTIRNQVQIIGRLGANPEVKQLESGKKMARFSVAVNESYKNKAGEWETKTQWHDVVAWAGAAGIAEKLLAKGQQVTIEGKLNKRSYTNKDGQLVYVTEIVANELMVHNTAKEAA